jgi:membrane protein implicated in regulation of membrane protease activity
VRNWANWMLVIGGVLCVIAELLMGAATGFDLALIGMSLALGGGIGLWFESIRAGLFAAAIFSLIYLLFFRRMLRHKLTPKEQPTNVDAIMGRKALVTVRIAPHAAGQVKVADEIWRAELAKEEDSSALEPGAEVTVAGIDGVTLKVR